MAAEGQDAFLCVDSGNFMGYPSLYLRVPHENGFVFTQAFQSMGLGLASGIGAAAAPGGDEDPLKPVRRS